MAEAAKKVVKLHDLELNAVWVGDTVNYHKYKVKADNSVFLPEKIYIPKDKQVPKRVVINLTQE